MDTLAPAPVADVPAQLFDEAQVADGLPFDPDRANEMSVRTVQFGADRAV